MLAVTQQCLRSTTATLPDGRPEIPAMITSAAQQKKTAVAKRQPSSYKQIEFVSGALDESFQLVISESDSLMDILRKEVIQPQVPLRLPCYDLVPITELALGIAFLSVRHNDFEHSPLSWLDGRCVQGSGTYSPQYS